MPQGFPQGRAQRVTSGPQGDGELELTWEQWELVLRLGVGCAQCGLNADNGKTGFDLQEEIRVHDRES